MKTFTIILSTLLIASTLQQAQLGQMASCSNACADCAMKDGKPYCKSCVRQYQINGKCIEDVSTQGSGCLVFGSRLGCLICERGYSLMKHYATAEDKGLKFCFKGSKYNAVFEERYQYNEGTTLKFGPTSIKVCENGYPSQKRDSCGGWFGLSNGMIGSRNQELEQQQINPCQWGSLSRSGNKICFKCKSGYISKGGKCVQQTSNQGCLYLYNGICTQCDVWGGYFMRSVGYCSR